MIKSSRAVEPEELLAQGQFVQAGRLFESRHRIEDAVDAYKRGAAWQEAARLLSYQGKFRDAGIVLLRSLPERPTPVVRLTQAARRDAMNAALCFARGGARREAVGLLMNLGEHQRAAGLLSMAGLRQEAVRAMRGEPVDGSPWPPGLLFALPEDGAPVEGQPAWSRVESAPTPRHSSSDSRVPWEQSPPGGTSRPQLPSASQAAIPAIGAVPGTASTGQRSAPGTGSYAAVPGPPPGTGSWAAAPASSSAALARPGAPAVPAGPPPFAGPSPTPSLPSLPAVPGTGSGMRAPPAALAPEPPEPGARRNLRSGLADVQPSSSDELQLPPGGPLSPRGGTSEAARPKLGRAAPGSLVQQELAACLATSPSDRSYGLAVNRVIELVWDAELLSPAVQRFLDDYVSRYGSRRAQDVDWASLYALGRLFEFHDRLEAAKRAYRALLSGNPQFADAATRLDHVEEGRAETSDGAWQPVHELIDGLHEFAPLPQFDAMPPLGVAPAGRAVAAPPPRRTPDSLSTDETRDVPAQRLSAASQTPSRARSTGDETVDFDEYVARRPDVAAISGGVMSHSSDELPPPRRARTSTSSEGWVSGEESAPRRTPGDGGAGEDVLSPGTVIANRYRVEGVVGSGGMATVYRATDLELEEVVALKVFQQVVQNRSRLERFRREMKLSRKLVHPNVVRIYEFGTWRGVRFITMELLVGDDLEVHLRKADGPLSVSEALRLMIQACEGLGAAHEQGVIHRDIKPQNLFVTEGGKRLKIMDFGIAKVTNSASVSVTGVRVGTPRYMAPEQIQGGVDVGPAADIYALGGVMYELLTGTPVFQEEDLVPLLLSHMTEEPEPPSRRNAKVPRDAEEIVLKLLRKNPEERFADCGELKKALVRAFIASQRA